MKGPLQVILDGSAKTRWHRIFRRRRKDALQLGQQADEQIEKLLIRRFDRLVSVRRFIFLWVSLFAILIFCGVLQYRGLAAYYQQLMPAEGGIYNEGMVGTFGNANPMYASTPTDLAVSRLVFSGLFKYDEDNRLTGDLAEKWELSESQTAYTVHLRKGVEWHDGERFTADDVVFTYKTIQNSEALSPFFTTWRGVKVNKIDQHTVRFDLPNSLSAFPHTLTNGIIPAHLLQKIPASQMRSAAFNTRPVGTGPFEWRLVNVSGSTAETRQQRINLAAFKKYWEGEPKLDSFGIITFGSENQLLEAFKKKQLNAMSGLEAVPSELANDESVHAHHLPLTGSVMAFFKTSHPILANANVRKALVTGVDRNQLSDLLPYPVRKVEGPLLPNQVGYDANLVQFPHDYQLANQLLAQEGWVLNAEGVRVKEGQPLSLTLRSQNSQEYTTVAQFLQREWAKAGVKVVVNYSGSEDLQRTFIAAHDYDVLLYGISIGADPDVFVYWHSSQANPGSSSNLNLSEYKSALADQALEAARTRSDPALRAAKYKTFLTAWRQDSPALALYQPNFLYITNGPVFGYERKAYNTGADRFYSVHHWMVRQERQAVKD